MMVDAVPPAVNKDVPESDQLEFPPEASALVQLQRGLTFAGRALPIVASYLSLYTSFGFRERVLGQCLDEEECEVLWEDEHTRGSEAFASVINELKGFYTKTGQIIATRQDLFPRQYTEALSGLTDLVDPMPASLVRAVVTQELLHDSESFEDVFTEFDDEPLGAASVAQVHRAVLTKAYGGGEVAVKVQRPAIEAKLLGDVAALKALAKTFRGLEALPVDYYTVFAELEAQVHPRGRACSRGRPANSASCPRVSTAASDSRRACQSACLPVGPSGRPSVYTTSLGARREGRGPGPGRPDGRASP